MEEYKLRVGVARSAEWYEAFPLTGLSRWTAKVPVKASRGQEVMKFFEAVDADVFV